MGEGSEFECGGGAFQGFACGFDRKDGGLAGGVDSFFGDTHQQVLEIGDDGNPPNLPVFCSFVGFARDDQLAALEVAVLPQNPGGFADADSRIRQKFDEVPTGFSPSAGGVPDFFDQRGKFFPTRKRSGQVFAPCFALFDSGKRIGWTDAPIHRQIEGGAKGGKNVIEVACGNCPAVRTSPGFAFFRGKAANRPLLDAWPDFGNDIVDVVPELFRAFFEGRIVPDLPLAGGDGVTHGPERTLFLLRSAFLSFRFEGEFFVPLLEGDAFDLGSEAAPGALSEPDVIGSGFVAVEVLVASGLPCFCVCTHGERA